MLMMPECCNRQLEQFSDGLRERYHPVGRRREAIITPLVAVDRSSDTAFGEGREVPAAIEKYSALPAPGLGRVSSLVTTFGLTIAALLAPEIINCPSPGFAQHVAEHLVITPEAVLLAYQK